MVFYGGANFRWYFMEIAIFRCYTTNFPIFFVIVWALILICYNLWSISFQTCGRNLLGRDIYGSYTLCGKLINAYGKTTWSQNVQVQSIFAALGLKLAVGRHRYVFDKKKNLRYGHVLMMMDQVTSLSHHQFCSFIWSCSLNQLNLICLNFISRIQMATTSGVYW